jgi:hypothetical protein
VAGWQWLGGSGSGSVWLLTVLAFLPVKNTDFICNFGLRTYFSHYFPPKSPINPFSYLKTPILYVKTPKNTEFLPISPSKPYLTHFDM